jgi:hypothetical protein
MTTQLLFSQEFPGTPEQVYAMLTDPTYARERAEQTGSLTVDVRAETTPAGPILTVDRELPAEVPSYAKSLVPGRITVTETQHWSALVDDRAGATFTASFNAPVNVAGEIELQPMSAGTVVNTTATITAKLPFIGGKLESLVREQLERYLAAEVAIGTRWLSG